MITIILPISRRDYLKPIFDCLDGLVRPSSTELLIIIDGDEDLERAVHRKLDSILYDRIQVISFGGTPAEDINSRRYRISAIHNKARHYIPEDCDYIFSIEDDTTYPHDSLVQMLRTINHVDNCVFVEGVQLGRRNSPYVGAWKADDVYRPSEIISVMPNHGLQEIDAGGLYCALIDADLYKMHQFEPFDKQGRNGLSCDVNFGLYLRQQGYKCLIDWTIQCDHIGDTGSVNLGNTSPEQLAFTKSKTGNWEVSRV